MTLHPVSTPESDGWTTIRKKTDEAIASSTVVQADTELFFTTVSGANYEIEIVVIFHSPVGGGTPDFKFAIGEDTTARGIGYAAYIDTSGAAAFASILSDTDTTAKAANTETTDRMVKIVTTHWNAAGGSFKFLWAQNTSGVNPTVVRAGSYLRYRRIT